VQRDGLLHRFGPSDATPSLDRLADLARRLLSTPHGEVRLPAAGTATAGDDASCDGVCALMSGEVPLVVRDAASDPRVRDEPAVVDGRVVAFLGVPLVGDRGAALGVLCVWDERPRDWTDADAELLGQLARSAVAELELAAPVRRVPGHARPLGARDRRGRRRQLRLGPHDRRAALGRPAARDLRLRPGRVRPHRSRTSRRACTPTT
jgi:GAF domain-containing protein